MRVEDILKENQPKVHSELNKHKKKQKKKKRVQQLSHKDIEELMRHDSYVRHNGAIRQVR